MGKFPTFKVRIYADFRQRIHLVIEISSLSSKQTNSSFRLALELRNNKKK